MEGYEELFARIEERLKIRFSHPGDDGLWHGDHYVNVEDLRALLAIARTCDDAQPYKDALEDLLFCRGEQHAIGGGPGWQERDRKAWGQAEELMRNEP